MAYFMFDLDGTLLNDDFIIPKKSWKFLKKIKEKGHKLGIATGRPYESVIEKIQDPKMFDCLISYNGAQINFQNNLIENSLPFNIVKDFIENNNEKNWTIAISVGENLYTDYPSRAKDIISRLNPKILPLKELNSNANVYVIRVISISLEQNLYDYNELLSLFNLEEYNVERSTGIYTLITLKKANKLEALKILQQKTNEKIVFFGDSFNDLDVFTTHSLNVFRVAPANAIDEIKKNADLVLKTTNHESLAFDFQDLI